jgi:hypothetical protein
MNWSVFGSKTLAVASPQKNAASEHFPVEVTEKLASLIITGT